MLTREDYLMISERQREGVYLKDIAAELGVHPRTVRCALKRGSKRARPARKKDRTPAEQRASMRWAQRLKRVFQIDVETCPKCGGTVKIIASIEDPPVIERILAHLASKDLPGLWPQSRAPPVCVQRTGRPAKRTGLHH